MYAEMAGIVQRLVDLPDGVTVEERLDEIQRESETTYPSAKRELMAVRYYLRWVMWACTQSTTTQTDAAVTNYAFLVSRLDRWRIANQAKPEDVLVVNFNYDTIFDRAFRRQLKGLSRPENVADYATWIPGWSYVKVHGSSDWAEVVEGIPPGYNAFDSDVVAAAEQITPTSEYLWWDVPPTSANSTLILKPGEPPAVIMPALALPLRSKSLYSCPKQHLDALREKLPQVTQLLTIGWRGQDEHFLKELRAANLGRCQILIVTKSEGGLAAVAEALHRGGVDGNIAEHIGENAFTTLFKSQKLHDFLARI